MNLDRNFINLLCFVLGTEELAAELRVRTCIELVTNRSAYTNHASADSISLLSPDYEMAVRCCAAPSSETCLWSLFALTSVLHRKIVSVYPIMDTADDDYFNARFHANTTLVPLSEDFNKAPFHVMWTRVSSDGPTPWTPNHFVPLVEKSGNFVNKDRTLKRYSCIHFKFYF